MSDASLRQALLQAEKDPNPVSLASASARRARTEDVPAWMLNPIGWVFYLAFRSGSKVEYLHVDAMAFTKTHVAYNLYDPGTFHAFFPNLPEVGIYFPAEYEEVYFNKKHKTPNGFDWTSAKRPRSLAAIAQRMDVTARDIYYANQRLLDSLPRFDENKKYAYGHATAAFNYRKPLPKDWPHVLKIPPRFPGYHVLTYSRTPGYRVGFPIDLSKIAEARLCGL